MPIGGLAFQRHQQLGRELADLDTQLEKLREELGAAYPIARVLHPRINDLIRDLRLVREELEERLWADHPAAASEASYFPQKRRNYDGQGDGSGTSRS
jgi:hypothetical protein